MKPLIVLLTVFAISAAAAKIFTSNYQFDLSARIAMSLMLIFTAIAHFAFTKGMTMMLPDAVPYKTGIVYLTGVIEIIAAIGLLIPRWKLMSAWLLIVFFILMLPANMYAALKRVDYQKASFDGNGLNYLWFRVPLQILLIAWVYFSAIK